MEESPEMAISLPTVAQSDNDRVVEMVRRWGGCTTDAVLDPAMKFFSTPDVEGIVSYRPEWGCAVVYGDPICAPENMATLATAFHRFTKAENRVVVYIATSKAFAYWAVEKVCSSLVEFGRELILDPSMDPRKRTGDNASLVRRKVKQAAREGVVVHEYKGNDPALEREIVQVGDQWLQGRKGHQVHISDVYLFDNRPGKRWIYGKRGDKIVAVLTLNRLDEQKGWLLNHLMITPDAPNGTSELLVVTALEILEKEGCRFVTVGTVTVPELGEIIGLGKFSTWLARSGFKAATKVVHLDGLYTFWGKYAPESRPAYLLFSRKRIGFREILGLKNALYGGKSG